MKSLKCNMAFIDRVHKILVEFNGQNHYYLFYNPHANVFDYTILSYFTDVIER